MELQGDAPGAWQQVFAGLPLPVADPLKGPPAVFASSIGRGYLLAARLGGARGLPGALAMTSALLPNSSLNGPCSLSQGAALCSLSLSGGVQS